MQPRAPDYYEIVEEDTMGGEYRHESGCCLLCDDAEENCLCYNCKCSKCFWYDPIEGSCDFPRNLVNDEFDDSEWFIKEIHYSTEKAVLCDLYLENDPPLIIKKTWIPLSILEDGDIEGSYIPDWFIENNELEDKAEKITIERKDIDLTDFLK